MPRKGSHTKSSVTDRMGNGRGGNSTHADNRQLGKRCGSLMTTIENKKRSWEEELRYENVIFWSFYECKLGRTLSKTEAIEGV
jgi:hypothetical protein